MNTLEVDYNSLSPDQKKVWIKAEMERQRAKRTQPKNGLSAELTAAFDALSMRLSPENLYCDGEISQTEAKKKEREIMREWRRLEVQAGRKVSFDEFPF